jgi:hypothetical protein
VIVVILEARKIVVIRWLGAVWPGLETTANSVWNLGLLGEKLECSDIPSHNAIGQFVNVHLVVGEDFVVPFVAYCCSISMHDGQIYEKARKPSLILSLTEDTEMETTGIK